ncbi:Signal transduction histidine kinase, contains PAS domain [Halapricum desulfuricans]|uniref:Signal transduction histidine kinase, contains PAS domain n=2 Tax=Halapricum desulfuricans TaxID=2841257 RepID=A0A897MWA3_9EURY|nr:Signal transduction histidine kinase, contains PAS domain [Halapricum desulfuricans]
MQAALMATVAVGFAGALLAWRERPKPGSVSLTILLAGQCWWSSTLLFRVRASGIQEKILWTDVTWIGVAVLPVAWLFFSLSYTGYSEYVRKEYMLLASAIPVLTIVLGPTNEMHHLLYTDSVLLDYGGRAIIDRTPGPWFWVIAYYTYLLGLLGAIPLVSFVSSDLSIFQAQSVALLAGLVVPWVTNVAHLLGALPTSGIDPTPIAFSLSAVLFLGGLTQFRLLGTNPAPIRPARQLLFDQIEDGLVILDMDSHIININEPAAEAVGSAPSDLLGRSLDDAIPQLEDFDETQSGRTVLRPDGGPASFDVSVSEIRDPRGQMIGRVLSLHDVSEYLRQQQRLAVLNRVFRHNVRTNTQVILSQIEYLTEHNSEEHAKKAEENLVEINELSDRIRTILEIFEREREDPQPIRVENTTQDCLGTMKAEYPDASISYDGCETSAYVDRVFDDVFRNVVRNALEHNTNPEPEVWIDVECEDDAVDVTVTDNGPGIDDEEVALLSEGTETPLKHGSGLGLALIIWGVEFAGGNVTFDENEPHGTTVSVELPKLSGTG